MTNLQEVRHILVIEDQKSRRIISLKEDNYSIGRDPSCTIVLYDRQVSRHHASLAQVVNSDESDRYFYRIVDGDLQGKKSTNGITINGKRCSSHDLKHGDLIWFGNKSKASYHIISTASELYLLKADEQVERPNPAIHPSKETQGDGIDAKKTIVFDRIPEFVEQKDLVRLSSLAEFSPNPIIEIDFQGKINYLNPAASVRFPNIQETQLEHPILKDILTQSQSQEGTSLIREVRIDREFFEQHIHYLVDNRVIRSYIFDVTKYKQLDANFKNSQKIYKFLVQQASEAIFLVDAQSKQILEANPAYEALLGYTNQEILELTLYDIVDVSRETLENDLRQVSADKPHFVAETQYCRKDGSSVAVEVNISRTDEYDNKEILCFAARDISDRKQTEQKLQYQAFHDALTSLPNRIQFTQTLSTAIANAKRQDELMAVMFLDLDSFKNVNDTLGHTIGDRLLQSLAQRLSACVREGDTIARWGGDEFTVLLPRIRSTDDTIRLAQRIFDSLKKPFEIDNHQLNIKISIGIAVYPQDGQDAETLLKNGDAALYRTKDLGRNHYQFYNPSLTSDASLLMKIETLLHQALERKEFFLHYQPQIQLATGEIMGMEALLRWQHPELGSISPSKFIPLASKTDLMLHIGKWVLETACEQNLAWQRAGLPPIPVSINLSARELKQPNLAEIVARTLDKTGLDPQWLELEVAEATLKNNLEIANLTIRDLQNLGVRIALDDFGTGFSSLGYLKQFAFRTLKLDRSFIRDLRGNTQERGIISAAIALGRGFNLRVLAVGIETQQQLDLLRSLQCEQAQGYWFSRPLTKDEATQLLITGLPSRG
ncbi:MAG: EAL domain-containing protein [Hydrococcus sp. Prado102]|jgi:diguanylate cyclase (GGDEF)-like protein/PAS domain S-box-containing protein|nr:EAL domain-containing protein [Hydrococcus sp. Prado102]